MHDDTRCGSANSNRADGGRGRCGECEDRAGDKRADRANREDDGSENVTPNAHDYLHALTEVKALRPGIGGPTGRHRPIFLFASLWLIT